MSPCIEQRDVGWGSTAASTALLQYEIDTHMVDLAKQYGEADALLAYRACLDAIPMLQALAAQVRDVGFVPMDSLYYASRRRPRRRPARRVSRCARSIGFRSNSSSAMQCASATASMRRARSSARSRPASIPTAWRIAC